MKDFKDSDIIMRRFMKQRGTASIAYDYTTHSHIFESVFEELGNDTEERLLKFLRDTFWKGYEEKELGCSNAVPLAGRFFKQMPGSDLIPKARQSGFQGKGRDMHPILQDWMIKNDPLTIACELPVWNEERSGFIDVVRYRPEQGIVEVCDFKPNAHKEKPQKVLTQLTHYAAMLSVRTGIPLKKIKSYYFDDFNCYQLIDPQNI